VKPLLHVFHSCRTCLMRVCFAPVQPFITAQPAGHPNQPSFHACIHPFLSPHFRNTPKVFPSPNKSQFCSSIKNLSPLLIIAAACLQLAREYTYRKPPFLPSMLKRQMFCTPASCKSPPLEASKEQNRVSLPTLRVSLLLMPPPFSTTHPFVRNEMCTT
jgi:hypothetical protein